MRPTDLHKHPLRCNDPALWKEAVAMVVRLNSPDPSLPRTMENAHMAVTIAEMLCIEATDSTIVIEYIRQCLDERREAPLEEILRRAHSEIESERFEMNDKNWRISLEKTRGWLQQVLHW